MRYGDKWRLFRKLVHQKFREELCESEHVKLIEAEATQMCHDFLTSPEGLMNHPKRFSNSIIMSICESFVLSKDVALALTLDKCLVSARPVSTTRT